jgi:predicted dehydrogenase
MSKRYVVVGTGGRSVMYIDALAGTHRKTASLVGLCDLSRVRMDYYNHRIEKKHNHPPVPTYLAADFDRMIAEQKPDGVVVCTIDSTHHEYIIRAMKLGCDVISEKPMTTDAAKAKAIFDVIAATGRQLRVTFNMRYAPMIAKVKEVMANDVIGTPRLVTLNWSLDTRHGADYFRRWHREKDKSGGLLVHKSTHHFDMINWWIDSYPRTVYAQGELAFYGRAAAERRGETYSYHRYTGVPEAKADPFALHLDRVSNDPNLPVSTDAGLYLNAEQETGYIRDRNVFGEDVTAEDVAALTVRYRSGAIMAYSLVAFSPWEGYRVSIVGDRGRLDVTDITGPDQGARDWPTLEKHLADGAVREIRVYPMFKPAYDVEIPAGSGGHGGGDALLLQDLFGEASQKRADPYGQAASHVDGAASMLVGISANESIHSGLPVNCDDLLTL